MARIETIEYRRIAEYIISFYLILMAKKGFGLRFLYGKRLRQNHHCSFTKNWCCTWTTLIVDTSTSTSSSSSTTSATAFSTTLTDGLFEDFGFCLPAVTWRPRSFGGRKWTLFSWFRRYSSRPNSRKQMLQVTTVCFGWNTKYKMTNTWVWNRGGSGGKRALR